MKKNLIECLEVSQRLNSLKMWTRLAYLICIRRHTIFVSNNDDICIVSNFYFLNENPRANGRLEPIIFLKLIIKYKTLSFAKL